MRSTYVKIPWAEPEDLAPTFREDLADMVARHGGDTRRLAHVYVRRGCIELTLVWEARPGEEACEEALLSEHELLSALRLTPPYGAEALTVRQGPLLGDLKDAAAAPLQLRVAELRPRVLLLPLRSRPHHRSAPEARALALSGGSFLAARVVSSTLYDSSAVYDIELLEAPAGPGPVLLELELGSWGVGLRVPLPPLLATADPAVAVELAAAVEAWPAGSAAELSQFLLDVGTRMETVHVCPAVPHRAGLRGLPPDLVNLLARHLAGFAQAAGLTATAALIRAHEEACVAPEGDEAVPPRGRARTGGRRFGLGSVLLAALGVGCGVPAQQEAFRAFSGAWAVALARTGVVVDLLLLGGNLARGLHEGQALLSATNLPVFAAFVVASLLALAWPFLSRRAWDRLALSARLPRYCSPLVSKALFVGLPVPAPATAAGYVGGVGMLLLEGVLHPATCLVTPLEAAAVAAVGVPLQMLTAWASGAASSWGLAAVLALRVELATVATAAACQAYLRARFQRAAAATAEGPGVGRAGAACGSKAGKAD
ncbi:hypothetical protein HYH03_015539 [Edaphochlamys debaryana]|uniref:Uncharacterized protein n=1 Tax=Edaphochlamys debaryana TaxID=47281 RepID=A0A835XLP1_9CHLO|nr:hypothetical protein HYH03_015539 [Edaphochlamys debaryana]|eukprot:KAG2485730.1 hypothetical protein HYH03_015539 [Edaphochlamys debaryana]